MNTITLVNPANFQKIGEITESTGQEIRQKVRKARENFVYWREIGVEKRVEYLQKVYSALQSKKDRISEMVTKEMGFPKQQVMEGDLEAGFSYFEWTLKNVSKYISPDVTFENERERHTVYWEPLGVAAIIQPWNFPFCQWVWSVVPNLAVGNTVVFKHSKQCLMTGKLLGDIASAILPEGVFNQVYGGGDVGKMLLRQDINLICFTGSNKVGKDIYAFAGKRFIKAVMELGGSAPGIIFNDVKIDEVLENVYLQRFSNNGQCCDGLKRLIVQDSIFNEVVEKLTLLLESKKIGNPENISTDFGPLSSKKQRDLLMIQMQDAITKGARVVRGGKIPRGLKGAFFEPTILTNVASDMRVWKEEVFGPVLPVVSFKTEKEAIIFANDTQFGLGAYVYSGDPVRAERVAKQIESGMINVNGVNYVCPFNPFGGYKSSGIGRENGKFGFADLTQIKVIATPKPKR